MQLKKQIALVIAGIAIIFLLADSIRNEERLSKVETRLQQLQSASDDQQMTLGLYNIAMKEIFRILGTPKE